MQKPSVGDRLQLTFESAAHGGESVARTDGLVIFVPKVIPGDRAEVELVEVKKSFARGKVIELLEAGPGRVAEACPAAAAGAGCCDLSFVSPERELELKVQILRDQLMRIGKLSHMPRIEARSLEPATGWRTRFRLGVDAAGKAGIRKEGSNDLVSDQPCQQAPDGALDGIIGAGAQTFTPNSEVVVAIDSHGDRHVVQTSKAPRGKTSRHVTHVLGGSGNPVQRVGDASFTLPATSFWQAHVGAPAAYSELITEWLEESFQDEAATMRQAWDLYGGVGLFVPAIHKALPKAMVHSVELSPQAAKAAKAGKAALGGDKVTFHSKDVFAALPHLPKPGALVLDPPRKGAGAQAIARMAAAGPEAVIHIGCDPATFARDLGTWEAHGYQVVKLALINAFPGTHHSESFALLILAPDEDLSV